MRQLFIILFALLVASTAWSAPFLVCDCQDNVEWYEITIDGGTPIQSDAVTADCTGDQKRLSLDMAPLNISDGNHSLTGRAANVWGVSSDVPFDFNKAVPSTQIGLGLNLNP